MEYVNLKLPDNFLSDSASAWTWEDHELKAEYIMRLRSCGRYEVFWRHFGTRDWIKADDQLQGLLKRVTTLAPADWRTQ